MNRKRRVLLGGSRFSQRAVASDGRATLSTACAILAAACAILAAACAPPLDLADWTIPVAEGVAVIEYAAVPGEDRPVMAAQQDLVVGEGPGDAAFYDVRGLAVDRDGVIYALDRGAKHVQVFDPDGGLARILGGEGQGPGELGTPWGMAIEGDRLIVTDTSNSRLSIWSLDGAHVADVVLASPVMATLFPSSAGRLIALRWEREGSYVWPRTAQYLSVDGELGHEYARAPLTELAEVSRLRKGFVGWAALPSVATSAVGEVYFADGEEYQIHKFAADGEQLWALRVAQPRQPTPPDDIEARLRGQLEAFPGETRSDYYWPDRLPSIAGLATDDDGRLWVFPWVHAGVDNLPAAERPVDIYDADGNRLFAGTIAIPAPFEHIGGDHGYLIAANEAGERTIRRYRIIEPFGTEEER